MSLRFALAANSLGSGADEAPAPCDGALVAAGTAPLAPAAPAAPEGGGAEAAVVPGRLGQPATSTARASMETTRGAERSNLRMITSSSLRCPSLPARSRIPTGRAHQPSQRRHQCRTFSPKLAQRLPRQALQDRLARRGGLDPHRPPVVLIRDPGHQATPRETIHELHRAVVSELQPLREGSEGD